MFEYFKNIKFDNKMIIGVVIVVLVVVALYFYFNKSEGFNNEEACANLTKTQRIIVKTMDAIPRNSNDIRDQINNGINYHDMQSRDIVLNDQSGAWCSTLKPDVKANVISAIEEQLDTEVELFDGGDIMDRHEAQSNADGIAYNGADAYDSEYAQV
jgi:hypothetical protein